VLETLTALAEANRFRIVELLKDGPRPVGAIGEALRLAQPQVSKHLRVLKEAGVVEVEPRAQQRVYGLRAHSLRELNDWIESYRALWEDRFAELEGVLQAMPKSHGKSRKRGRG
jgi:DNA-binding transcriptional ArsR family regulator